LVDLLGKKFELEMIWKEGGYVRTAWLVEAGERNRELPRRHDRQVRPGPFTREPQDRSSISAWQRLDKRDRYSPAPHAEDDLMGVVGRMTVKLES
jgi:hypothetical protein